MVTTSRRDFSFDNTLNVNKTNSHSFATPSIDASRNNLFNSSNVSSSIAERLFGTAVPTDVEIDNSIVSNPDLMPSSKTMQVVTTNNEALARPNSQAVAKAKLNTSGKVLVASYFAVVFAVVLVITMTIVSIASSMSAITGLNTIFAEKTAEIAALQSSIKAFEDTARIEAIANGQLDLDYPSNGQINFYQPLKTKTPQTLTANSNWFDALCDWFSSIVGG